MSQTFKEFFKSDEGAVAVEYVLLFLIAIAALVAAGPLVKAAISAAYTRIVSLISTVAT